MHDSGLARGIDWDNSIIIELGLDVPGIPDTLMGTLLSQEEKFIKFEIETDHQYQIINSIYSWLDVTARTNVGEHNRGTGRGAGAMALKIRRELCASAGSPPSNSST